MIVIIPLAGKGMRFKNAGYTEKKPLIKILGKRMLDYVFDNIDTTKDTVFIFHNDNITDDLRQYNIKSIIVPDTAGTAETLYYGLQDIIEDITDQKCLLLDGDTYYTTNILDTYEEISESLGNIVFYTRIKHVEPIYSYIALNSMNIITDIAEKKKISDNANTGAYGFNSIHDLYEFSKYVVDNKITSAGEPYTSCIIKQMLKNNISFTGYELLPDTVVSFGTPEAVDNYIDTTRAFMIDLDGTIVLTDDIYFKVWSEIMFNFRYILTREIFQEHISGRDDRYVKNRLLRNANININDLSSLKDRKFIQYLDLISLVDGVLEFIRTIKIKGFKCCVVTNCNKPVAEAIIKHIGLFKVIDFIVSTTDCQRGKPYPEPYEKAISRYGIKKNQCIAIEDSISGIKSALNARISVCGITTKHSSEILTKYGVSNIINNYKSINIDDLLHNNQNNLITRLSQILLINPVNIRLCSLYKGGNIASTIAFKMKEHNMDYDFVFKHNTYDNNNDLAKMADLLQLYDREYYFYEDIAPFIPVHIPRYITGINTCNGSGIIMEDMYAKGFVININLDNNIECTFKIVNRMCRLHSKFWGRVDFNKLSRITKVNGPILKPLIDNFIDERQQQFTDNWESIFGDEQWAAFLEMKSLAVGCQDRLAEGNQTLIHGDIKSPNIFYDPLDDYEPYFLDWQHCMIGKGVQDLIFFIIESFDISGIESIFHLLKIYYHTKITEAGILYDQKEYEKDIMDALCFIPYFTSIWFGTVKRENLICTNFPYLFIDKTIYLFRILKKSSIIYK